MRHAVLFTLLLLGLLQAASAQRVFPILGRSEATHELLLSEITMPRSTAGVVIFQPCETCDSRTLPVDGETRYLLNHRELPLDVFNEEITRLRGTYRSDDFSGIGLTVDLVEPRVKRINVYTHPRD